MTAGRGPSARAGVARSSTGCGARPKGLHPRAFICVALRRRGPAVADHRGPAAAGGRRRAALLRDGGRDGGRHGGLRRRQVRRSPSALPARPACAPALSGARPVQRQGRREREQRARRQPLGRRELLRRRRGPRRWGARNAFASGLCRHDRAWFAVLVALNLASGGPLSSIVLSSHCKYARRSPAHPSLLPGGFTLGGRSGAREQVSHGMIHHCGRYRVRSSRAAKGEGARRWRGAAPL
jgi:hypothetical protein